MTLPTHRYIVLMGNIPIHLFNLNLTWNNYFMELSETFLDNKRMLSVFAKHFLTNHYVMIN